MGGIMRHYVQDSKIYSTSSKCLFEFIMIVWFLLIIQTVYALLKSWIEVTGCVVGALLAELLCTLHNFSDNDVSKKDSLRTLSTRSIWIDILFKKGFIESYIICIDDNLSIPILASFFV